MSPTPPIPSLSHSIYVVLDLETTGFSRSRCHIIEIAAQILTSDGVLLEDGTYTSLIRPPTKIPGVIVDLTGITEQMVKDCRPFSVVIQEFFAFIDEKVQYLNEEFQHKTTEHIILVAHNGKRLDIPFLKDELCRNQLSHLLSPPRYGYALDTHIIAQKSVAKYHLSVPQSYKLSDLFEYVSSSKMGSDSHRALVDVKATSTVLRFQKFWDKRRSNLYYYQEERDTQRQRHNTLDDSDVDSDDSTGDDDDNEKELAQDEETNETRVGWQLHTDFKGVDTSSRFQEQFAKMSTRGNTGDRTGLQCSVNSVNSPGKAWRQIFTHSILDKIVAYTNDYGLDRCKGWTPINRQDLLDFISILFISKLLLERCCI